MVSVDPTPAHRLPRLLLLCLWLTSLLLVNTPGYAFLSKGEELTPVEPDQERAFYLPIEGNDLTAERLREKEVPATDRFLRREGGLTRPSILPTSAPELYLQVEPFLAMDMHFATCKGKEKGGLTELLARAQARLLAGEVESARAQMETLRTRMPCAEDRLNRSQMAEMFIWSALSHPLWPQEPAMLWLRTGLAVDPEQASNQRIPSDKLENVRRAAYEIERDLPRVDLHMPQDEGAMWALKNLTLDGRRLVFEKLFVQLTPGIHFVQVSLPNERIWGAFIELEAGTRPDLAGEVRKVLGFRERYRQELRTLLFEGVATGPFLDGLKTYALRLKRNFLYFTALTEEEDGTWITFRRFEDTGSITVPLRENQNGDIPSASSPVVLSQPYEVELGLGWSGMLGPDLENYRSPGGALSLDLNRRLGRSWRVGTMLVLGGRAFERLNVEGESTWFGEPDISLGLFVGHDQRLRRGFHVLTDVGYSVRLNPLQGLPVYCDPTMSLEGGIKTFQCGPEDVDAPDSYRFNAAAYPHGPKVRMGLSFRPFYQRILTLSTLLRVGYSPLLISLPNPVNITLTTQDTVGQQQENAQLILAESLRSHWVHQLELSVGIKGTY